MSDENAPPELLRLLFTELPADGYRWSKKRRDAWVAALMNALALCYEVDK